MGIPVGITFGEILADESCVVIPDVEDCKGPVPYRQGKLLVQNFTTRWGMHESQLIFFFQTQRHPL